MLLKAPQTPIVMCKCLTFKGALNSNVNIMYLAFRERLPTETAMRKYYASKWAQTATLMYFVLLLLCCKDC